MGLVEDISNWIKAQVDEALADGIVLGLSGGVDSAVVASLSKKALAENVLALIMPCKSEPQDEEDANFISSHLGIKTERIDLERIYEEFLRVLPSGNRIALANLKPRLRMTTLYYFANEFNYLVAGTGNRSEIMVGYFTKYGDGGVDILPLGGLLKNEVKRLAEDLGIPKRIIEKVPSAGLWPGQTDEKEIGISYEELDKAISILDSFKRDGLDPILVKVEDLIKRSSHKRSPPKIYIP